MWEWHHPHPIVELQLLKRRNFATAMLTMVVLGAVLYGTTVLLPEFLQNLLGYSAAQAGECMAAGGILMMFTMPLSGFLSREDRSADSDGLADSERPRWALYHLASHLSLQIDFRHRSDAARVPGGRPGIYLSFRRMCCPIGACRVKRTIRFRA